MKQDHHINPNGPTAQLEKILAIVEKTSSPPRSSDLSSPPLLATTVALKLSFTGPHRNSTTPHVYRECLQNFGRSLSERIDRRDEISSTNHSPPATQDKASHVTTPLPPASFIVLRRYLNQHTQLENSKTEPKNGKEKPKRKNQTLKI
ncbi:Uncharacterized protein Rs2_15191 [Raphanus sativus]|nr:Uncharacterized protein Rs2_15191 [Raphanus sativus]